MRILLAIGLVGCSQSRPPCVAGAASLTPASGPVAAGPISLTVDAAEGARIWVDGGGTSGWIDVPQDGRIDAVLAPDTTHAVLLEQCGSFTDSWTLTTASNDTAAPTPELAPSAWAADLRSPELIWHNPPIAIPSAALAELTGDASGLLVGFDAAGAAWVGFAEVTASAAWQHSCVSLAPMTAEQVDTSLSLGPDRVQLTEVPDRQYDFEAFTITATVDDSPEQGPTLWGTRMSFLLDLRTLPGGSAGSACALLAATGSACLPCADQSATDAEPSCLPLDVEWPELAVVPGLLVDPQLGPDPGC